jgi:hypothetical protein
MDLYEIEPYRLAGEHTGKWALTITGLSKSGTDEQPFQKGPIFHSERGAPLYGVDWVILTGRASPENGTAAPSVW